MPPALTHVQDALLGESAPFRWMVEHLEDVLALLDPDGTVAYLSPSYERRLGRAPGAVVGTDATDLVHPDDREGVRRALAAALAQPNVVHEADYRYRHADGSWRHFHATGSLLPACAGGERLMLVARDVTEQRRGEAARDLLASLVHSSQDIIVTVDLDAVITSWNPAAERLMGHAAKDVVGASAIPHVPPARMHEETALVAAILGGASLRHHETERIHKDGHLVPLSMTVFPLRGAGGDVVGIGTIARDVRERHVATEALRATAAIRSLFRRAFGVGASDSPVGMRRMGRRLAAEVAAGTMEEYVAAFADLGLGELRIVEARGDRHVVAGMNLLESRPGAAAQPTCGLPLGYLEAAAGLLAGGDGLGAEVECQSQGAPRCTFVVRSRRAGASTA